MPSIIEVDTIKNKTGTQNTVLSTDGSGNNTLNAGVIKSNTGSNTGLTIASDGQITVNQNNPTLTLGANTTFPSGQIINVQTNEYNGGAGSNQTSFGELSTDIRFAYTPISASSKMIVSYQGTSSYHSSGSSNSFYGIGHEVTASDGTATPANLVSGRITVAGGTSNNDHFQFSVGTSNLYIPLYIVVSHSPSYSLGQKIWYTVISKGGGWHYFSNSGDIRFQAIEVKGMI